MDTQATGAKASGAEAAGSAEAASSAQLSHKALAEELQALLRLRSHALIKVARPRRAEAFFLAGRLLDLPRRTGAHSS